MLSNPSPSVNLLKEGAEQIGNVLIKESNSFHTRPGDVDGTVSCHDKPNAREENTYHGLGGG